MTTMTDGITISTLDRQPDYADQIDAISIDAWPEFLRHANDSNWGLLFGPLATSQLLLCDSAGELMAVGHTAHIRWDGTNADLPETVHGAIARGEACAIDGESPNTLCALAVMVSVNHRRKGLSSRVLQAMRALARAGGMSALIVPVRPTWKQRYPLTPMERYVTWKNRDGEVFDPWLRVHVRAGAQVLKIAPRALTVDASVAEWEAWAGMAFPDSGAYVVPGALQPVQVNREADVAHYDDPNVWMRHPVSLESK